ncbi:hypothetical protein ABEB36_004238 [Hypothenemus hampei]|uniref:Uncharacterized protein n=1 Tax=Hypothenemus hampei TaxID=57062 RepID=A0ABD1F2P9_HYPHA
MESFKSKLGGRVLTEQAREVIANVIFFMQKEAAQNSPFKDFKKVQERASLATGVSLKTIQRISKEMRNIEEGASTSLNTPNVKRTKTASKSNLDDGDEAVLRRHIINFSVTEKRVPTLRLIHHKFVEDYNYTRKFTKMY